MKIEDIAKLLDEKLKPIKEDVEEMRGRVATIEDKQLSHYDVVRLQDSVEKLEKRETVLLGKMEKLATKEDLEKLKADLKATETRIIEKIDYADNRLDKDVMQNRKEIRRIEEHLDLRRMQ